MAKKQLNIPARLDWATNANRTITPAGAGITAADGWDFSQRPPPKLMNYLHTLQEQTTQRQVIQCIGNYQLYADQFGAASNAVANIGKNNNNKIWIATHATTGVYYSHDGIRWTAGTALGANANYAAMINTDTDGILVGTASNISQSTSGTAWATGGSGNYVDLANWDTGDYFLAVESGANTIEYWATGFSGGGVAASVTSWGTDNIECVAVADSGINLCIAIDDVGNAHGSVDGGANWSVGSQNPSDAVTGTFSPYAVDANGNTIVTAGVRTGPVASIVYSQDGGASWTEATFNSVAPTVGSFRDVISLGNKYWVAAGYNTHTVNKVSDLWYSIDDGATWTLCAVNTDSAVTDTGGQLRALWCSGNQVFAGGSLEILLASNQIYTG